MPRSCPTLAPPASGTGQSSRVHRVSQGTGLACRGYPRAYSQGTGEATMQQPAVRGTHDERRPLPGLPPIPPAILSTVLIAIFALTALLSSRGNQPPAPLGRDAPNEVFSALRARDVLARILGDGLPHPTGSAANAAVRDRIVAEFARLGLAAQVQRRFVCGTATCATVENIVVKLPGASPELAVLLSAHYDSVAAGPGASDDGAGVAALVEVARALQAGPPLPRDVWLLANDGEELGLLGAEAFVREPEFASIATVVNLEARGTTGASLLIETQPGNAAIVGAVRRALARPGGTSLDYEIYKTLPNDTDFTVYRREGRSGVNFAWAHGASRYHTPLDNLAQLDPGSLQHHGDNTLAMARELAAAQADLARPHDAVFFNLFGRTMLSWPVSWNPAWLLLALAGWLALGARLLRARQVRPLPVLGAGVAVLLVLALPAALGWGMHALLGVLGATPAPWTAQAPSLIAAFVLLAIAAMALLARPMARWFGLPALALASLLPFALIAIAAVLAMPGASHAGLLPLLAGVLAGHVWPRRPALWAGLAAMVAAMLWFPYVVDSYAAIGHPGLPVASLLMALLLLPLLPALAGLRRGATMLGGVAVAGALAFAVLAVTRPAFDADVPRPLNLLYVGDGGAARVYVAPSAALPTAFLGEAGFTGSTAAVLPWSPQALHAGRGGPTLASPRLEILADTVQAGRRQLQVRLRSVRGASEAGLRLPASVDLASVRVAGQALAAPRRAQTGSFRSITIVGLPAEGVLVDFAVADVERIELFAVDASPGIPAALAEVARARDRMGVPIHAGDRSLAWTRVVLARAR